MRNLKIYLAYDGAEFSGWQVQPGRRTIQGTLGEALARITGLAAASTLPQSSGRTDAGVHALAQVASYAIHSTIPLPNLVVALKIYRLPASIPRAGSARSRPAFHARLGSRLETYRYRIYRNSRFRYFGAYVYLTIPGGWMNRPWARAGANGHWKARLHIVRCRRSGAGASAGCTAKQPSSVEKNRVPGRASPEDTAESARARRQTNVRTIYHSEFFVVRLAANHIHCCNGFGSTWSGSAGHVSTGGKRHAEASGHSAHRLLVIAGGSGATAPARGLNRERRAPERTYKAVESREAGELEERVELHSWAAPRSGFPGESSTHIEALIGRLRKLHP